MKIIQGQKHLTCRRRMRELGHLILERRRPSEDNNMCFNTCWGGAKKRETDFSPFMPNAWTGDHRHKFKYTKFCLSVSKIKIL